MKKLYNPTDLSRFFRDSFLIFLFLFFSLNNSFAQTYQWAKKMGGSSFDFGYSISVDANGNVYTTGSFEGTVDFDPGAGFYNLSSAGGKDIFISKLDASGNFIWAKKFGETSSDEGQSVAIDVNGDIYITGYFNGIVDFDPSAGIYNLTSAGSADIFISKLDASGNFIWAKNFGGILEDRAYSIAVYDSGVYTTGVFQNTVDFDPGTGTYNLTSSGLNDIFISKLDTLGNFYWAKRIGGAAGNIEESRSIAIDANQNVYITGYFENTADFDPGSGTYNLTSSGLYDIFVCKLDVFGTFLWAKKFGGSNYDYGYSIALDINGNVYTTGNFKGTVDFDPGAGIYNLSSAGSADIFISKLDASGNFLFAKRMGYSNDDDGGRSITVDSNGDVYTTGFFSGTVDFDPGPGTYNLTSGVYDIFVSKLDASGNFILAGNMGGGNWDFGNSITVDNNGNVYTTGNFRSNADFDPGTGVYNLSSSGLEDVFIAKYFDCTFNPVTTSFTVTNVLCNGGNTGSITSIVSGGVNPLTFSWSSGQTTQNISGIAAGNYSLTVTDNKGCYKTDSMVISEPNTLTTSLTATNVSCFGAADGSIDLTVTGGTSPYTYSWSNGPTSQDIGNLTPGNYTVTVTDANGCIAFNFTAISQPAVLGTSIVKTDVNCSGNNDGTIDLTASGGTTPYTFNWSNGATTEDLTGLSGGTYNVTITDVNGCTATNGTTISQPSPLNPVITGINPGCAGTNNGIVDLDITGGTPSYTYSWNTGATTQDLTSLGTGTYIVTITDANTCTITDSVTLSAAGNLVATVNSVDISCFGQCDGDATVTISGGTSPYTISWNTTPPQTTATATGLCDGTYTVNVSDANNCQSTPSVTIVEPPVISFSEEVVNTDCGSSNGTATITTTGGVPPYSFVWSNGQSDSVATGLSAGTYFYTMTDANGCSLSDNVTIIVSAPVPEICLVTVDSSSSKNLVVWEKPISSVIDSFRIYRDIVGVFTHIGSVAYADLSKFVDTTNGINPNITSYKYKIASVDTCGNISALSDFHKTIHLQINGANLTWDNYVGFDSSFYYRILRDTLGLGNLIVMDSVTNSNFTWTDIAPPSASSANYMIEIVHPEGGCSVTKAAENHNSSRSNKATSAPPGSLPVADFSGNNLNINIGGSVNFSDLTTNNPTLWSWTFQGGNPTSSTQQHPQNIVYNSIGCFNVTLVASNINGNDSITKTCYINVTPASGAPVADFLANITNISTGGTVDFLDLSANNPSSWKWLFSGGTPAFSLTQNPAGIVYNNNGCFDVTLIASNVNGSDTLVKSCYITVNPVGIKEEAKENSVFVVPNPNNGKFTIQIMNIEFRMLNIELKIYNLLGEQVFQTNIQHPTSNIQPNLSSGIYFLKIFAESETVNKKLIIQ